MRRVVIALLISIPSLVRAQPGLTAATEPADEPITSYVQPGAIVGLIHATSGNNDNAYGALSLEAGHRIGTSQVWLHGLVAVGGTGDLDQGSGPNSYSEAVAGVEGRTCAFHGIACGVAGLDVGIRHESLMSDHLDSFRVSGSTSGRTRFGCVRRSNTCSAPTGTALRCRWAAPTPGDGRYAGRT